MFLIGFKVILIHDSIDNQTTVIIVKVREVRENSTSIPYNALF